MFIKKLSISLVIIVLALFIIEVYARHSYKQIFEDSKFLSNAFTANHIVKQRDIDDNY